MKSKLFLIITLLFTIAGTAVSCTAEEEFTPLELPPTPTLSPAVVTQGEEVSTTGGGTVSTPLPITPAVTASPLPPATSTTTPPVMDGLPVTSKDLLFLADGALKLWRHNPAQIDTLMMGGTVTSPEEDFPGHRIQQPFVGDMASLSVSSDGMHAIVSKLVTNTSTISTYEISYLNIETSEHHLLLPTLQSYYVPKLSVSPDGQMVVISGLSANLLEELTLTPGMMGTLYVMETAVNSTPIAIDSCTNLCSGIIWHNDGNLFVYGNQDGLKMYNVSATAPELLVDGASNNEFPLGKHFSPISWANNGRSLLTWYGQYPEYPEGSDRAVFDMPTKNVMIVPNSGTYIDSFAQIEWMYDARLFVVRQNESQQAIGEIFRADGDNNQIILDEMVMLSTDAAYPAAPMHWENGRFAYALFNVSTNFEQINGNSSGLYQRISFNEQAERLNDTPTLTYSTNTAWEKENGSGLIVSDVGTMWYISTDGTAMVNMETAVGGNAHSFNWLK